MPNYPVPYQNNWGYSGVGQQMYPQYQQPMMSQAAQPMANASQNGGPGLIWVDGEIGAKAFQMPQGWAANQPIALWDTNDTVIYLKSTNPMGMPNPLQKAHYTLEGGKSGERAQGFSGDTDRREPDMSQYVRKDDMDRMKRELMEAIQSVNTSGQNAGGNGGSGMNRRPNGGKGDA